MRILAALVALFCCTFEGFRRSFALKKRAANLLFVPRNFTLSSRPQTRVLMPYFDAAAVIGQRGKLLETSVKGVSV